MKRTLSFTYYWNNEKDAQGRNVGFFGFKSGHALQIAYRGFVEVDFSIDIDYESEAVVVAANKLFRIFNDDVCRPRNYRGPSMLVGSVLEINSVFLAVTNTGFRVVSIFGSNITPCPDAWIAGPSEGVLDATPGVLR